MPEFRTCEEYVLNLLEENQNEVARLEEVIRKLNLKLGELYEELDSLKSIIESTATVNYFDDQESSITFSPIYEYANNSEFSELVELVPEITK